VEFQPQATDVSANHAAGIATMDFLVVPTVGFRLLFALVIPTAGLPPQK